MKEGGHDAFETANVTHYKNPSSINSYLQRPTLKDKKKYGKSLAKYVTKQSSGNDNSDSDFEPPPQKKRKQTKTLDISKIKKSKPFATVSQNPKKESQEEDTEQNDLLLVAVNDSTEQSSVVLPNSQNLTNNYMQMLKQNPIGMFMGANLSNCTININMPK